MDIGSIPGYLPLLTRYNKDYLSGFSNRGLMLKKFTGCLLGAAIGDALGMPNESTAPNINKMKYGYRRPYRVIPTKVSTRGSIPMTPRS